MGEDVNTVSPTLGFIIKTIDYDGYALPCSLSICPLTGSNLPFPDTSSTFVSLPFSPPRQNIDLASGDVGGQKTLRSYWRNYFEKTDALIWVVDATDRLRVDDCREELHGLLQEEVSMLLTAALWPTHS
jgi:ADP-ribosylation factor-like protein 2